MPAPQSDWTVEMVHALPDDGNRYEVIDGELLVTPTPSYRHQDAALELATLLKAYVVPLGFHVLIAPAAVTFSSCREVQPDVLVLPRVGGRPPDRFEDAGRLELAVEIMSPTTARRDRYTKRRLYQSERVPEYWIIDLASRIVERWRPDDEEPEVLLTVLTWQPDTRRAPLTFDLEVYFRAVHEE